MEVARWYDCARFHRRLYAMIEGMPRELKVTRLVDNSGDCVVKMARSKVSVKVGSTCMPAVRNDRIRETRERR